VTEVVPDTQQRSKGSRFPSAQPSTIQAVAVGGSEWNQFIAMYCSNGVMIIRHVGENGVPTVRQIPCFQVVMIY